MLSAATNPYSQSIAIATLSCLFWCVSPANSADLQVGDWTWSLPSSGSGTASASGTIYNYSSGGQSGSIGLRLRLSTAPYGSGGSFYEIARADSLPQLSGGYHRDYSVSESFSLSSVPAGTYHVVLIVSEYTAGGGSGYTIRDGATASRTYTISSGGSGGGGGGGGSGGGGGGGGSSAGSDLQIGDWTWSLPSSGSGTASATGTIYNYASGGHSGSIGLRLRLSTAPYGSGGTFYEIARTDSLPQLSGGYHRDYSVSESFSLSSVPAGTYHIVLVVSEYTGGSGSGYTIHNGATASSTYTISSGGGGGGSDGGSGGGGGGTAVDRPNSCRFAHDGECDDGRLGADTSICDYGTDEADCALITTDPPWDESNSCPYAYDGECDDGRLGADTSICDYGTDEADCALMTTDPPSDESNSCPYAYDGECDDGRPGADTSVCEYGTDEADCVAITSESPGSLVTRPGVANAAGGAGGAGCGAVGMLPMILCTVGLAGLRSGRTWQRELDGQLSERVSLGETESTGSLRGQCGLTDQFARQ